MPVTNALVLDPWLEPLPLPGPFPICPGPIVESVPKSATCSLDLDKSNIRNQLDTCLPRVMVLNSETFTLWRNHYERLQDVVRGWEPHAPRIITLSECYMRSFQTSVFIFSLSWISTRIIFRLLDLASLHQKRSSYINGCYLQTVDCISGRKAGRSAGINS